MTMMNAAVIPAINGITEITSLRGLEKLRPVPREQEYYPESYERTSYYSKHYREYLCFF